MNNNTTTDGMRHSKRHNTRPNILMKSLTFLIWGMSHKPREIINFSNLIYLRGMSHKLREIIYFSKLIYLRGMSHKSKEIIYFSILTSYHKGHVT